MIVQHLGFRILNFQIALFMYVCSSSPGRGHRRRVGAGLRANHAQRTVEPLVSFLHHADPMNETECLGPLMNIVNNSTASLVARDVALLEWMRHISRHISYHIVPSHLISYRTVPYISIFII